MNFNNSFGQFGEDFDKQAQERMDQFRREAEENRRRMFGGQGWPNHSAFADRPFPSPTSMMFDNGDDQLSDQDMRNLRGRSPMSSKASSSGGSSGGQGRAQPNQQQQSAEPRVHHIPIVVEGRRSASPAAHPQQQHTPRQQSPIPMPDHSMFNGSSPTPPPSMMADLNHGLAPQQPAGIKRPHSAEPNTNNNQEGFVTRITVNQPESQPRQQSPVPEAPTQSPEPPVPPKPMNDVQTVMAELERLHTDVEQFSGSQTEKQYRYLDEMLTRCLIKLDNINTDGQPEIRVARKEAINSVHQCLALLESRSSKQEPSVEGSTTNGEVQPLEQNQQQPNQNVSIQQQTGEGDVQQQAPGYPNPPIQEPPKVIGTETAV